MIHQAAVAENPQLASQNCHLIIDSGFSFTSILPFFGGLPLRHAAVRVDVGGKLLTNLLIENLSYKEINLKGEGYLVNHIKESLIYISTDFNSDMERVMNRKNESISREYVLPDYKVIKKGYIRLPDEDLDSNA